MKCSFDWAARYASGSTPWDLGRPHPELAAWCAEHPAPAGGRALVPGCGTAHDAAALAQAGWAVTALDLVPEAPLPETVAAIGGAGGRVVIGDALDFHPDEGEGPFDLVLDHTFFCALRLDLRPAWGELVRRCLRVDGELLALVFPLDRAPEEGGPPFGYGPADLAQALGPDFELAEERELRHPATRRSYAERLARFYRRR